MKRVKKIILILVVLYILHTLFIGACYYIIYSHDAYVKNEYFDGSERQDASIYNDLVSVVKKNNDLTSVVEQTNDNKLVKTSLNYYKFNSDKSKIIESYGICIYKFTLNEQFHLTQVNNKLDVNWYEYFIYNMGSGAASSYSVKQAPWLKGDLKINSLEYYYEGDLINKKDSLNGRLKTILIKPESFEIGFNNDHKRMIYIEPTESNQPLSVTFYQKEDMMFLIFFSSEKSKITEESINEFIVFE